MADEKGGKYGVGGFTSSVNSQQKYIVINTDGGDYDTKYKRKGAQRFLPYLASHELFHALGLDHPRSNAREGEKADQRSWDQIVWDIAPGLNFSTALGTLDTTTGTRTITYSFTGAPKLVPHGNPATQAAWLRADPNTLVVEEMTHMGDTGDAERKKLNRTFRDAMKEAFALHESLFNVKFVEASDPSKANLLLYSARIPPLNTPSYSQTRGSQNAYTHGLTIMSYNNAVEGIWPIVAAGDIYAMQRVYGQPPENDKRNIITAERLGQYAGAFWDHKPLAIKLTESPMVGALTIDMGAPSNIPAITGTLKNKEGDSLKVRHHIGKDVVLKEVDATGADIALDVTGATGASIKVGKPSSDVKLNGRRNSVVLGSGKDELTHVKGFGHVIAGLSPEDSIAAKAAGQAVLQHWDSDGHDKGTLVTLVGDDSKNKGSVFIKDAKPDDVMARLKGITSVVWKTPKTVVKLNAVDKDKEMAAAEPATTIFREARDVIISARHAAGHGLSNFGGGCVVIKMTQPEYDSRIVTFDEKGQHYRLEFRDGEKMRPMHLQQTAKIAICGPDGQIERVVTMAESRREHDLNLALKMSDKDPLKEGVARAALPYRFKPAKEQLG